MTALSLLDEARVRTSIVGFTGTRRGLTPAQRTAVIDLLDRFEGWDFHHGDCVGADDNAASIADALGYRVVSHPPADPSARAFYPSDVVHPDAPYMNRNRDIVDEAEVLIAAPHGPEETRSGTWATVRYARRQRGMRVFIAWPDGSVTQEVGS